MLQVRAAGQTSSRLVWDSQAETYRGAPGGLLSASAGYAELLEQLKARVRVSRVLAAHNLKGVGRRGPSPLDGDVLLDVVGVLAIPPARRLGGSAARGVRSGQGDGDLRR